MLPTYEVSEMANILYQLIPRVHVQPFQTHLEGLSVYSLLANLQHCRTGWTSHHSYLLEGFVEIVKIVYLESIKAILSYEIGNILSTEEGVFAVKPRQHVFFCHWGIERRIVIKFLAILRFLSLYVFHHQVNSLWNVLVSVNSYG
jgi:hypothetical protein